MKKKQLIVSVIALLCLTMALSSCSLFGGDSEFIPEDVYANGAAPTEQRLISYSTLTPLSNEVSDNNSFFLLFTNTSTDETGITVTKSVYSHLTNSVIASYTDSAEVQYTVSLDNSGTFYTVTQKITKSLIPLEVETTTTYCDTHGTSFYTAKGSAKTATVILDHIVIDNIAFAVAEDGTTTRVKDFGIGAIPALSYLINDTYYAITNNTITLYNTSLEKKNTVALDRELAALSPEIFVLDNGDILVQAIKAISTNAKKYDMLMAYTYGDVKYDLITRIYNKESGEFEDIDLDYIISDVINTSTESASKIYNKDKISNICTGYKIPEDKTVPMNVMSTGYGDDVFFLSNDGKAQNANLDNNWKKLPVPIANNYYSVNAKSGEIFILNDELNTVFSYSNNYTVYGKFVVADNAIYNILNGEKVFELADDANGDIEGQFYWIENESTAQYEYYDISGSLIGTFDSKLTLVASTIDGYLLTGKDDNIIKFSFDSIIF